MQSVYQLWSLWSAFMHCAKMLGHWLLVSACSERPIHATVLAAKQLLWES